MAEAAKITTQAELDHAFRESTERPVVIFKHSLTCPVSTAGLNEYIEFLNQQESGRALFTLIEIQNARDVSAAVADATGVRHESPQALVLQGGKAVWHASHWDISSKSLTSALEGAETA